MKTLYLDIFSGISGDMFIGAMLDLGVPFSTLDQELAKLGLTDYHLHADRKHKASIEGVKFDVHAHDHGGHAHHHAEDSPGHSHGHDHPHDHDHGHDHPHSHEPQDHPHGDEAAPTHEYDYEAEEEHVHGRSFSQIRKLIWSSALSPWVKEKSIAVFERIARAEGKIHGQHPEHVHFHEVGAIDSIIDIVGAAICLELLGKPEVLAAPVVEGTGWVRCAHGRFPIPAPATLAILAERGVPVNQCDEPHELITPTGAAILAEFVQHFGPIQMAPEKIGYGLGTRNNKTRPNVLRAVLGQGIAPRAEHDWETDQIAVLETNLDDVTSEILGYVVEQALAQGALDAFHTPIQMKKSRPAVLLTVLCVPSLQDQFTELLLRETSALGVRRSLVERRKLRRSSRRVQTAYGEVEVKIGTLDGQQVQAAPEYESCKRIALAQGAPLKAVYQAALNALNEQRSP